MKTCLTCMSTTFDDMTVCYGCLEPFEMGGSGYLQGITTFDTPLQSAPMAMYPLKPLDGFEEDLTVEEPSEKAETDCVAPSATQEEALDARLEDAEQDWALQTEAAKEGTAVPATVAQARFHVTVPDLFGYDIYMCKEEGAELTIGCARDNNIVLPHTESCRHILRLFYSNKEIWAQDKASAQKAHMDNTPLTGTRAFKQGVILKIGEASIELIDA